MKIEAYAVVSDDDRITDASGRMPAELCNDKEWDFFQAGLDAADISVLGRISHETTANVRGRLRLILTSAAETADSGNGTIFWNPDRTPLEKALAGFGRPVGHLAITGGRRVFDYFLHGPHRYTAFHLSRIEGVRLPGGIPVFTDVDAKGMTAEEVLRAAGYQPGPRRQLDAVSHVVTWIPEES